MKELQAILKAVAGFKTNEKAILATVVALEGSGYRRPGARMLIDENGYSIGTVSGGCLEADVLERAKKVLETGESTVITYDTTKDENSVFGLGMGCRGIVRILLESVTKDDPLITYLSECLKDRKTGQIKTLIKTDDSNLKIGSRVFSLKSSPDNVSNDEILEKNAPFSNSSIETTSFGEFFVEKIEPPLALKLFGAGYDALPLAEFAEKLGWLVTVVDHRQAWANRERFPDAAEIIAARAEELDESFFRDENSVAVVMTHNYDRDLKILPHLLNSNFLYVGALGPKKRMEKMLAETSQNFAAEQLEKLYAPIGLDIGAKTPEEIALSIIAEINAVLANRAGGFLRDRKGSIYGRSGE